MINGDFVLERARRMAQRLMAHDWDLPADLLTHAFQTAWGRAPTDAELKDAIKFVSLTPSKGSSINRASPGSGREAHLHGAAGPAGGWREAPGSWP